MLRLCQIVTKVHSRGVKSDCILNQIPGYHETQNFSLDIMHIALEGLISFEVSCVLFHVCNESRYITISAVSQRINSLWSMINVDRCNKPPELNALDKPGRLYPSMKAVQARALLRYLPIVIGDVVPSDDKHWLLLLHLSELIDMIFSPVFTVGMVNYLRDLIADHLSMFASLYAGVDGVKFKPKHHLLVHLPSVILASGPLVGMSCMRYELKKSFFKRCAHIVCNFSNICQTLPYRHQQHSLYSKLSNMMIRNVVSVACSSCDLVGHYDCADVLCSYFGIEKTDDVYVSRRAERASVTYAVGQHIVTGVEEEPVFGKIELFVSLPTSSRWSMVVSCLKTRMFHSHYHCYVVEYIDPKIYKVIGFDELFDCNPVCCYKKYIGTQPHFFVRLPYHIVLP